MNKVEQTIIPPWLANPDLAAPCPCGMGLMPGQQPVIIESEIGLKRWVHQGCYMALFGFEDDDEPSDD
jgi:hypothetical protein